MPSRPITRSWRSRHFALAEERADSSMVAARWPARRAHMEIGELPSARPATVIEVDYATILLRSGRSPCCSQHSRGCLHKDRIPFRRGRLEAQDHIVGIAIGEALPRGVGGDDLAVGCPPAGSYKGAAMVTSETLRMEHGCG